MNFNRRNFLSKLLQVGVAGVGFSYTLGCAQDSEEALIVQLNVYQPAMGDKICIGEPFPIQWELNGQANLDIELSKDNGTSWQNIFTNIPITQNEILWQTPAEAADRVLLRFLHATDKRILQTTGVFSLTKPALSIENTFSNEEFLTGQTIDIQWEASCIDTVKIEYSLNGGARWTTLAKEIPAKQGNYQWELPLLFTKIGKLRVVSEADENLSATSEGTFAILPQTRLDLKNYPALQSEGGTVREELAFFGSIAIVRLSATDFQVMNLTCTHQGCTLLTEDNGQSWYCPCHLANFTRTGCVISGQAGRALDLYESQFDQTSNEVVITFRTLQNKVC